MIAPRVITAAAAVALIAGSASARAEPASNKDWRDSVRVAVHSDATLPTLAPTDVSDFCPRYQSLEAPQREQFWSELLIKVAESESGGDSARTRWLIFDGSVRRPAFRRGLFQISVEAAQSARYNCAITSSSDLSNPDANAACAVRIIESDVGATSRIAGAGRYWPTLAAQRKRSELLRNLSATAPCA